MKNSNDKEQAWKLDRKEKNKNKGKRKKKILKAEEKKKEADEIYFYSQ